MRRLAVLLAAAYALVFAVDALGFAIGGDYQGSIKHEPGSPFVFDFKKDKVKNVAASGLDFTCKGGDPGTTPGVTVDDSFKVNKKGRFGGKAPSTILGFDPKAELKGRLKSGGKARGTIRLHGELDPENQPDVKCDTGTQRWKAKKAPKP